jgi:hypothetical protein
MKSFLHNKYTFLILATFPGDTRKTPKMRKKVVIDDQSSS